MKDQMEDSRIAHIKLERISKIKTSCDGFIIPIIEHSGLRININLDDQQANFLAAYLQIAISGKFANNGHQLCEIPRAPVVIEVHEWSMGMKKSDKNIIARFRNNTGDFFDIDMNPAAALNISNDIVNFLNMPPSSPD